MGIRWLRRSFFFKSLLSVALFWCTGQLVQRQSRLSSLPSVTVSNKLVNSLDDSVVARTGENGDFEQNATLRECNGTLPFCNANQTMNPVSFEHQHPHNSSPFLPEKDEKVTTLSLIVQLRGELANELSVLAGARYTQRILERAIPNLKIKLIGQHQANLRWTRGRDDLQACFPALRNVEFSGGQWDDETKSNFAVRQKEQTEWLGDDQAKQLHDVQSNGQIAFLKRILEEQKRRHNITNYPFSHREELDTNSGRNSSAVVARRYYSLPYLTAGAMATFKILDDPSFYDDIRSWLALNETKCCAEKPGPEETVYHFRNFMTELGAGTAWKRNFVELSPQRSAEHLFGKSVCTAGTDNDSNTRNSSGVVIVSRYPENLNVFEETLNQSGIPVRLPPAQTGIQDFCFLMAAQNELVGFVRSTYVRWAAILGNATNNRLFSVTRNASANFTCGNVKHVGARSFYFDTFNQPEQYTLNMHKGRLGKQRESAQRVQNVLAI